MAPPREYTFLRPPLWLGPLVLAIGLGLMLLLPAWSKYFVSCFSLGAVWTGFGLLPEQWRKDMEEKAVVVERHGRLERHGAMLGWRRETKTGVEEARQNVAGLVRVIEWCGAEDGFLEFFWRDGTRWTLLESSILGGATRALQEARAELGLEPLLLERRGLVLRPVDRFSAA